MRGTLRTPTWTTLAAFGLAIALSGCGSSEDPNTVGGPAPVGTDPNNPNNPNNPAPPQTPEEQVKQILDARKADGRVARFFTGTGAFVHIRRPRFEGNAETREERPPVG